MLRPVLSAVERGVPEKPGFGSVDEAAGLSMVPGSLRGTVGAGAGRAGGGELLLLPKHMVVRSGC